LRIGHLPGPRLKTVTLGCKVNQYETQYVREGLLRAGYRDAEDDESADLCVVNSCTVTSQGDAKSRQVIRRLARQNPSARIVVMGCYATREPQRVARLPGVMEVVTDKRELPDLLGRFGVVDVPTGISSFGQRHRAYVKVQDGCLLRCSFCIIPHVRPKLSSRPLPDIVEEVRRLAASGYREIVLTGIHLGHYGVDFNRHRPREDWMRLSDLLRRLAVLPDHFRLRLSSIEATEVTRSLLNVMAEYSHKVVPHLHISMQSGADTVLRRMRRRWGSRRFVDRCQLAQQQLDQPALTTDVIVGFPGETEDEFLQTAHVVRQVGFSKIHIFPFSPRRGTPAARLPDQITDPVKHERRRALAAEEISARDRYYQSLRGRPLDVLVESPLDDRPGYAVGTSCRYAPVELPLSASLGFGQLTTVVAGPHVDGRIRARETGGPAPGGAATV